jgi:hypothetical protein
VGDTVRVDFHAPRALNSCLITVERGDIFEYRVVTPDQRQGSFDFFASADHRPNVYVSVMAASGRNGYPIYPTQVDTDIPTLYFGYTDIAIRSAVKSLTAQIGPEQSSLKAKPGERISLDFTVTDEKGAGVVSEMAVCVVDEAVLALTRFTTPSMATLTDFDLPLSVFAGDLRQALLSQDLFRMFSTHPVTGGGAGLGVVAPTVRKRFDPVAYFNPSVLTDDSGSASVEFELPDSTTTYRVYVVACDKGAGFASEDRQLLVTKDFFVQPSLPRFFIPGDEAKFPITAHNRTDETGTASLRVEGSKDLDLRLPTSSVKVEPGSSNQVLASVRITGGMEDGKFTAYGKLETPSDSFSDAIEESFPIHSRYLPVHRSYMGHFTKNRAISLDLPAILKELSPSDIAPQDFTARIALTTTNWNRIAPGLKYLLRYPYGCVEQTSSGVIPLAGMRSLIREGIIPGIGLDETDTYLQAGVARLLSMQTTSGGFSYWPDHHEASWWGTMYATFAITLAREAGLTVPEERLNRALDYLEKNLSRSSKLDRYHGRAWTRELALFNLAVNGKLKAAELQKFFDDSHELSEQSKALLILAASKIDFLPDKELRRRVERLKARIDPGRSNYYNSSYRAVALCLLAAEQTGASRKLADDWAGSLMQSLKPDGRWSSTADTGWCLYALSKYFQSRKEKPEKEAICRVSTGPGEVREVSVGPAGAEFELDPFQLLKSRRIELECDTKEILNYTVYLTYPDMERNPKKLDQGFSLTKRIENLNGKDEIRVGDVVRVILEVDVQKAKENRRYRGLQYVALDDPVPAGLVPINSELETEGVLRDDDQQGTENANWRYGFYEFTPSHLELRNDIVRAFRDRVWPSSYRFSYLARATTEGTFWMRSSRISQMYYPDRYGKTMGKRITILPAIGTDSE